jgi:hypothetical protein
MHFTHIHHYTIKNKNATDFTARPMAATKMPPGNAGGSPNAIYFLQKEPWRPVFVFAVSGLGAPASRRLAVAHSI